MKKSTSKIFVALITCLGTIIGGLLGNNYGKQSQKEYIDSQISTINGNNNTVNINDVKELVEEYNNLQSQNESLIAQNAEYFQNLTESNEELKSLKDQSNNEVEDLKSQLSSVPNLQFKDIGLSIDGDEKSINKKDSSVTINNRTYYSEDIIKWLVEDDNKITIDDDTMYVGKIIKEKSYISNEWEVNSQNVYIKDSIKDSYGNPHTNVLYFENSNCNIIYNLKRNFSLLKFDLSVSEESSIDRTGVLTIKADDSIVYTSPSFNKLTEPFNVEDISINNCSLLTIEYNSPDGGN